MMKKEIILRVIIDGGTIATAIQKNGFDESLNSSFEINGILQKIVDDEKDKLNQKLKTTNDYTVKEPMTKKDGDEVFLV